MSLALGLSIDRTLPERRRQEALVATGSTTQQKVEQAVAEEETSQAQLATAQASVQERKAALLSSQAEVEAERRELWCSTPRSRSLPPSSLPQGGTGHRSQQPGLHPDHRPHRRSGRREKSTTRADGQSGDPSDLPRGRRCMGPGKLP